MNNTIENKNDKVEHENKDYLIRLVNQLEELHNQDVNIPFRIKEIKENGFIIKTCGMFAFIAFDYMPWQYSDKSSWGFVFESLKCKQFYGRIHLMIKDPKFILLNGKIPQFKKPELEQGHEYAGIIIKKIKSGLLIDFGSHFKWKCGSIVGFLHSSQLGRNKNISSLNEGDEIQAKFFCANEKGQNIFRNSIDHKVLHKEMPSCLNGEIVKAQITGINKSGVVELLVDGKFKGIMLSIKDSFTPKLHEKVKQAKAKLRVGHVITCEVVGLNSKGFYLILKWLLEFDTEIVLENSFVNRLDDKTLEKLALINLMLEENN
jgi:hypothetical protein